MPDRFAENMIAYRRRMSRTHGGVYGRSDVQILRRSPTIAPVFFRDSQILKSDNDVPNAPAVPLDLRSKVNIDNAIEFRHEIILEFEHPLNLISMMTLALSSFIYLVQQGTVAGGIIDDIACKIQFTLLRVPLARGSSATFALDKLSFSNAHRLNITSLSGRDGTPSTLYNTPSNFEEDVNNFILEDYGYSTIGGTSLILSPSFIIDTSYKPTYVFTESFLSGKPKTFTDGPYFGIHLFLTNNIFTRHNFPFGVAPSDAGDEYDLQVSVFGPRLSIVQPDLFPKILNSWVWETFPF